MKKLDKPLFTDRRKKPVTIKGTKIKKSAPSISGPTTDLLSQTPSDMSSDMSSSAPIAGTSSVGFEKGGAVHRGQGAVMRFKTTKYC